MWGIIKPLIQLLVVSLTLGLFITIVTQPAKTFKGAIQTARKISNSLKEEEDR